MLMQLTLSNAQHVCAHQGVVMDVAMLKTGWQVAKAAKSVGQAYSEKCRADGKRAHQCTAPRAPMDGVVGGAADDGPWGQEQGGIAK